jgi:hypothetical protein
MQAACANYYEKSCTDPSYAREYKDIRPFYAAYGKLKAKRYGTEIVARC